MGQQSNLISLADRTTAEQRKIAKMGGIASGEARRQKRNLKEAVKWLLDLPLSADENAVLCKLLGVHGEYLTQQYAVAYALLREAKKGKCQHIRLMCELDGSLGKDSQKAVELPTLNIVVRDEQTRHAMEAIKEKERRKVRARQTA